jgi:hypothetical protein
VRGKHESYSLVIRQEEGLLFLEDLGLGESVSCGRGELLGLLVLVTENRLSTTLDGVFLAVVRLD